MIKINDVYNELSYTIWKSTLEIKYGIINKKQMENMDDPSMLTIYNYLRVLKGLKYVEERERKLSEDELKVRSGRAALEYKLTESGVNARNRFLEDIIFNVGVLERI